MARWYWKFMPGFIMGIYSLVAASSVSALAGREAAAPVQMQSEGTGQLGGAVPTAFVNVSVIPMDTERVLSGQSVLIDNGQITAMGPANEVAIPAGAARIDGTGKFLIPGLADMHAHLDYNGAVAGPDSVAEAILMSYLADGITTLRMMGGNPQQLVLRDRWGKGEWFSPRLYVAGPMINRDWGPQIVSIIEEQKAAGYDHIKIHTTMKRETFDSLVATAKRVGLPVTADFLVFAGGSKEVDLPEAFEARIASIEHLSRYIEALSRPPTEQGQVKRFIQLMQGVDESKIAPLAEATRRAGVWNVPTFVVYGYRGLTRAPASDATELAWAKRRAGEVHAKIVKALADAGAGLLLGTDVEGTREIVDYGFAVHQELVAFVAAGLSPYQALETGTRNVAQYFGILDSSGTIEVGKRADLVLLHDNPLVDITRTQTQAGVMIGGRWLSRADLDARRAILDHRYKKESGTFKRIALKDLE